MKICFDVRQRSFSFFFFLALSTILFFTSLTFFPQYVTGNQDLVYMGLVGEWEDYGDFHAIKVWKQQEVRQNVMTWVTYAGCATSRGFVIFDINDKAVASFIPLGACYDLEIKDTDNGSSVYAYIVSGETGLYIFNIDNPQIPYFISLCDTPGIAKGIAIRDEYACIADGKGGLQIIDIVDKNRPGIVGSCDTPENAESVSLLGNYALIAAGDAGLIIVDITNRKGPGFTEMSDTPGYAKHIVTSGNYAYIADKEEGLQVIRIIDPNDNLRPELIGNCNTPGQALAVALKGNYVYLADERSGLQIIDISENERPVTIGGCITPGGSSCVDILDNYAFVAGISGSLQIIDISTKIGPNVIGGCDAPFYTVDVGVAGDYAYVAHHFEDEGGLKIINVSDKTEPALAGGLEIKFGAYGVTVVDNIAYLSGRGGNLHVIDISNKSAPKKKGTCSTGLYTRQVFIEGDYAYVAVGNEKSFDINDFFNGLRIVSINDPNNPKIIGSLFTPGTAFDVVAEGNYAYIADGVNGLLIINITDKGNPVPAGNCKIPGSAVALDIAGDYAYVAYWGAGFYIIDITDKNNLCIIGTYNFHGHATDVSVAGEYAFVTDSDGGLRIFYIGNKTEPVHLGSCGTPGSAQGVAIAGSYAYIADFGIPLTDPNGDSVIRYSGLRIVDIQNKTGPEIAENHCVPYYAFNLAVTGGYAYVAESVAGRGFYIIDITQRNGPVTVGSYNTPGYAEAVAIAGNYAYVADWDGGLQIIDITNHNNPVFAGSCVLPGYTDDIVVDGNYAYMTDGDFHIIDITDKSNPHIVGSCDTVMGRYVAASGNYAYVASSYREGNERKSLLQIIDVSDKDNPRVVGECDDPVYILDMVIKGDLVYIADGYGGFQIISVKDKTNPKLLGICNTLDHEVGAVGIDIAGNYAYIADYEAGLQVIDIGDPNSPHIVWSYDVPGKALDVAIEGSYVYVADGEYGILKLKIDADFPSKGNLIVVAGGSADTENVLWPATQTQANYVFQTFINNGYESYDIWYQNPVSFQDPDNDGIFNQLVVDDPTPTKPEFLDSIIHWAMESPNSGPLYIYLIGHGAEDRFQIMPNEVLLARELKEFIDRFQNGYMDNEGTFHAGTERPVVVIIESAASGTFIDDLMDDNVTVVTSTKDGPSYVKPDLLDSNPAYCAQTPPGNKIKSFRSFTTAFIYNLGPSLASGPAYYETYLKEAFIDARNTLHTWILNGLPFSGQVPQMAIHGSTTASLDFSRNGVAPIESLQIDQNIVNLLTIIEKDSNGFYTPFTVPLSIFSSDPNIIDPGSIEITIDANGVQWYGIRPKKNGTLTLMGSADQQTFQLFLSASVCVEVAVDDPEYSSGEAKKAVIVAGYQGTGDYLWESTNTIANHAYRTLRAMGYTKNDIYYYNPYLLQDYDGNGEYDEISGYPHLNSLNPDCPCSAFSDIKQKGTKELFLFFVDHGNQGAFCLNPSERLTSNQLTEWIDVIAGHVEDKIILLYDACYSGSFLKDMEENTYFTDSLRKKLMVITSTDPNQAAYYLNQGMVSFSYPFLDEWFLTHSLMDAYEYASQFLPREGQTPLTSDPNIILSWDHRNIYYVDESRPVILDPNIIRANGKLLISSNVYSLTGISEVWAIVDVSNNIREDKGGKPITDVPVFYLNLDSDPNYPYGGRYSLVMEDPYPHESRYNLTLYAKDKGERPKVTSHKKAIGKKSEHKIKAVILASVSDLFPVDEKEMLTAQVERAEAIMRSRGLDEQDIKKISCLSALEIPDLAEGQNLFVYLIGMIRDIEGNPYFCFNDREGISPEELENKLDPNIRHFILADAPYAASFLSRIDWQEKRNWAGVASTDQESLFFSIEKGTQDSQYCLFPCFSNFFFSGIMSGATVAQAYRMAQNAVSLTRQMPELFLPEGAPSDFQTIHRYLDYYIGMAAIPGETNSLLGDCIARIEDNDHYILSLSVQPRACINKAWAVLTSPTSFYQKTIIVDLVKDNEQGLIYGAEVPLVHPYYMAYFMVEGRMLGGDDTGRDWTEWQEVSISETRTGGLKDKFEFDDDPNSIRLDPNNILVVNDLPQRHTFDCEGILQTCEDTDWIHFYALKGHVYEIYAQDLSEYGYFIQISLYDSGFLPLQDNGMPIAANNYLAFDPPESRFYFLKVRLGSNCPQEGVEYILGISDLKGEMLTSLLLRLKGAIERGFSVIGGMKIIDRMEYVFPDHTNIIYPDTHCYKFNGIPPKQITINVYEDSNPESIAETSVLLLPRYLNEVTIDLTGSISTVRFQTAKDPEETDYYDVIEQYLQPLPSNLPYGDMDSNFNPEGDYDGDLLTNCEEVLHYGSHAQYPTIPLPLHRGVNLFYFPVIYESFNIVTNDTTQVFHYNSNSKRWDEESWDFGSENAFNAIYTSRAGMLYLDLREVSGPVLYLRGFLLPGYTPDAPDPYEYLDANLFDPGHFGPGSSGFKILDHDDYSQVETISSQNSRNGAWKSSYRFFGRPSGNDTCFYSFPYDVHVIHKRR
ncbi:MAG: C13 family peptidase [bacterium]